MPQTTQNISTGHISEQHLKRRFYSREQLENSPSRKDGLDAATEAFHRRSCFYFVARLVQALKLTQEVQEAAVVYVNRFYACHSYVKHDRFLLSAAAVLHASKECYCPRLVAHVAMAFARVKKANKPQQVAAIEANVDGQLDNLVQSLVAYEKMFDQTINFDFCSYNIRAHLSEYLAVMGVYTMRNKRPSDWPTNELPHHQQVQVSNAASLIGAAIFKTQLPMRYPSSKVAAAITTFVVRSAGMSLAPPSDAAMAQLTMLKGCSYALTDAEYEDIVLYFNEAGFDKVKSAAATDEVLPPLSADALARISMPPPRPRRPQPSSRQQTPTPSTLSSPAPSCCPVLIVPVALAPVQAYSPPDMPASVRSDEHNNNNNMSAELSLAFTSAIKQQQDGCLEHPIGGRASPKRKRGVEHLESHALSCQTQHEAKLLRVA